MKGCEFLVDEGTECGAEAAGTQIVLGVTFDLCALHEAADAGDLRMPDVILDGDDPEGSQRQLLAAARRRLEAERLVSARVAQHHLRLEAISDPHLVLLLDKVDEINREGRGHPTKVELAQRASMSESTIDRTVKRYGIEWRSVRSYRRRKLTVS